MSNWNLWHGCHKYSEGCKNCYVYRIDSSHGRSDSFIVRKNSDFDLPVKKDKNGGYKLKPEDGTVFTCMTSDFFVEDADCWRDEAWSMIKSRPDLNFCIVTKRISQVRERLPLDWGDGYENVAIACTMESRRTVDERLPIFLSLPVKRRLIFCAPLLEEISLKGRLAGIDLVSVGGESGNSARPCKWEWVEKLYVDCLESGTGFHYHQIGSNFIKDGRTYRLPHGKQFDQAGKAQKLLEKLYGKPKRLPFDQTGAALKLNF